MKCPADGRSCDCDINSGLICLAPSERRERLDVDPSALTGSEVDRLLARNNRQAALIESLKDRVTELTGELADATDRALRAESERREVNRDNAYLYRRLFKFTGEGGP